MKKLLDRLKGYIPALAAVLLLTASVLVMFPQAEVYAADYTLKSLTVVNAELNTKFNPNVHNYSAILPYNAQDNILVYAMPSSYDIEMEIDGFIMPEPGEIFDQYITLRYNDGFTSYDVGRYMIRYYRLKKGEVIENEQKVIGGVAGLKSITLSGGTLQPAFDPNITEYSLTIGYSESVMFSPVPISNTTRVICSGYETPLAGDSTQATITTISGSGAVTTYTITIHRLAYGMEVSNAKSIEDKIASYVSNPPLEKLGVARNEWEADSGRQKTALITGALFGLLSSMAVLLILLLIGKLTGPGYANVLFIISAVFFALSAIAVFIVYRFFPPVVETFHYSEAAIPKWDPAVVSAADVSSKIDVASIVEKSGYSHSVTPLDSPELVKSLKLFGLLCANAAGAAITAGIMCIKYYSVKKG